MVSKRNYPMYHFSITIHLHFASFYRRYTFEKKNQQGEMLIEQIIEFELIGPWPPGRTCTPTTRYFHD